MIPQEAEHLQLELAGNLRSKKPEDSAKAQGRLWKHEKNADLLTKLIKTKSSLCRGKSSSIPSPTMSYKMEAPGPPH